MITPSKRYLQFGGAICMIFLILFACRPEPILPPGPTSIKVEATVPTRIYSNVKWIFLDASVTPSLNGRRVLFFSWACTGFPAVTGSPEIKDKEQATAIVENLAIGEYKFLLTVKDNLGNINLSNYQLEVLQDSITGIIPIAKAGPDQQITAPRHDIVLDGSESITNNTLGRNLYFKWACILQPAGSRPVLMSNNINTISKVEPLREGLYKFQLEVKNEYSLKSFDTMEVRVLPDPLKGTTRIFENVKWQRNGDDDWGYYIYLYLIDPDFFAYRYEDNMQVLVWDEEKKDWIDNSKYTWNTISSDELFIKLSETEDMTSYFKMEGLKTKVKVTLN